MNIGKNFQIKADEMNVILSKKVTRTRKDTQEKYTDWEIMGYFSTPKGALHFLLDQQIRETDLKDLKSIVSEIDKLHALIDGIPKVS